MQNYEYLLFNVIVLLVPVIMSFEKRIRFVQHWQTAFMALGIVALPYLIWDILVTGRHWWFNEQYTLDVAILGLPLGEWLFFISVPFSCLFIWGNPFMLFAPKNKAETAVCQTDLDSNPC